MSDDRQKRQNALWVEGKRHQRGGGSLKSHELAVFGTERGERIQLGESSRKSSSKVRKKPQPMS